MLDKHPTFSLKSGVENLNAASNFISQLTIDSRKIFNINLSRKHVLASMQKIGNETLEKIGNSFKQTIESLLL